MESVFVKAHGTTADSPRVNLAFFFKIILATLKHFKKKQVHFSVNQINNQQQIKNNNKMVKHDRSNREIHQAEVSMNNYEVCPQNVVLIRLRIHFK